MRLAFKNGDYYRYPRCDFQLDLKWGKSDIEAVAVAVARGIAASLGALPGVKTTTHCAPVPLVNVIFDPAEAGDLGWRIATIDRILEVLEATGLKYTPLPIVDLATALYRARHAWRDRDILAEFGPDPVRFERLQALRLPTLAPFLGGSRPVFDAASFNEFHTGLDAYEQALVRHVAKEGGNALIGRSCSDGCHRSWMEVPAAALIGRGWLIANATRADRLKAGPKLDRLNQSAGELLAD